MMVTRHQIRETLVTHLRGVRDVETTTQAPGHADVDLKLRWWTLFWLGLYHRKARREAEALIAEQRPIGVQMVVREVSVF